MEEIGGYKVIRLLDKGGMSEVYEVERTAIGSRHALKLFNGARGDAEALSRFQAEGRLLAKLNHPRIVRVSDIGVDAESGRPYFVMDLVLDGRGEPHSLAEVEAGAADEPTVGRWYDDVREGLSYVHGRGVVHRDLKLQNVLIGADGHAVLADFGVSRVRETGTGGKIVDVANTIVKAREGRRLVMGTVGYMAPELEMGMEASEASDWYALGVIVYRLLTGSWCDSRTDVNGNLDGYDPVWKEILPKLLHSNPAARECPSYAGLKAKQRERDEFEAETRFRALRRMSRRTGWAALLAALVLVPALILLGLTARDRARFARALAVPTFHDLFQTPPSARGERRVEFENALVDALVLTREDFGNLRKGAYDVATLRAVFADYIERLARDEDLSESYPEMYSALGETSALTNLLTGAVERLDDMERTE